MIQHRGHAVPILTVSFPGGDILVVKTISDQGSPYDEVRRDEGGGGPACQPSVGSDEFGEQLGQYVVQAAPFGGVEVLEHLVLEHVGGVP